MAVIYSARWVLPISAPPIQAGAVAIAGSTIVAVGPRPQLLRDFPDATEKEFGDAVILPGLVNAHSHLELTVMRGFLEPEEHDFFAWLRKLTAARLRMTDEDLLVSATCGAIEAARAGITCLGDSSSIATQAMRAMLNVGVRGIVYQESFGPDPKLATENFAKVRAQISEMRAGENDLVRAGVSPHAPYTVSAPQLEMIARLAIDEKLPLMMHAAESKAEQLLLTEGRGAFADGLAQRGIAWKAPGVSTIRYLHDHGVLQAQPLLAHCINVDAADLQLIKDARAAIAHCPKSNAKLRHGHAPFAELVQRGLTIGLGSDSVASNNSCDILEEARFATLLARVSEDRGSGSGALSEHSSVSDLALPDSRAAATVTAEQALFAATLGGARALGLDHHIGSLAPGRQADITVVNLTGAHQQPASNPLDTLIFSSSGRDVILTMVDGREIYRQQAITTVSEPEIQRLAADVRNKIDRPS